jgi:XTP/dITP diphosphohydrolase
MTQVPQLRPEPEEQLPPEGRITLLLTSPRSAPGLLTWSAWERLRSAGAVLAADPDPIWLAEFEAAGVGVQDVAGLPIGEQAGRLVGLAGEGPADVVWWGSPDGDPGLTDALAEHLSRRAVAGMPPQIEVLTGSHDVPGARLLDLVAVMDTLRSPGGCPWDAEQTHASLLPYLLEETHEVIEAVEGGDREHLAEELGDLLLQVVFHARVAAEHESQPFSIDDVAAGIVAKLVRRHPHVFGDPVAPQDHGDAETEDAENADGDAAGLSAGDVEQNWEQLKAAEKLGRAGFEGIPLTLPALARAQKMLGRLERAGADPAGAIAQAAGDDALAAALLAAVVRARATGQDAESALRAALGRLRPPLT